MASKHSVYATATHTDADTDADTDANANARQPDRAHAGVTTTTTTATMERLVIERLILHQTARDTPEPLLVAEPAHLDSASERWFAGYLAEAERRADWQATLADPAGDVVRWCDDLFASPEAFVAASQALARRLHALMRARHQIAPGDLVALVYRTPVGRAAALLKLDPDESRLVRQFAGPPQRRRVRIRLATGLLPDTRALQKCALLLPRTDSALVAAVSAEARFTIRLLDTQAGPRSDGVAAFFYRGFLGAELLPSARRVTRCFLTVTDAWLGAHQAELEITDVLAFYAVRRQALAREFFEVRAFAAAALPHQGTLAANLTDALARALRDLGVRDPLRPLPIDAATARPVVRTVALTLDGGARLTVAAEDFPRLVRQVTRRADGKVRLVIETLTLREGGYA